MFIDEAKIYVKGGDGGDGSVAFRREKYVPLGGPAGGTGGYGGDVVLYVDEHRNTLHQFSRRSHFKADRGRHGGGSNQRGASGDDVRVAVPPGTVVYDAQSGDLVGDLTEPSQELVVARGGRGGRGNASFATSTNQAPRMAEHGEPGEERWLRLELKLLADVGLVGMPNAGKSTLLAATTAARPKIAPYPFTTLHPNLGMVALDQETEFVLADIPGLIEGAAQGKGLGHEFLRHVERTRVLIHLIDGMSEQPLADFAAINGELAAFSRDLAAKPQLVAFNKVDMPQAEERWPEVKAALEGQGYPVLAISALTGYQTRELLYRASEMLAELPEVQPAPEGLPVFRLEEDEGNGRAGRFVIERVADGWRVSGTAVERLAAMTVWNLDESVRHFQRRMRKMGITQALRDVGVVAGDTVFVGDTELVWED
jgi:GTP-binding protein